MIKINLLAEGKRPAAVRKPRAPGTGLARPDLGQWMLLVGMLPPLLAALGYWWVLESTIQEKDRQIRAANQEYENLKVIIKEVEDFEKKKGELEHKIRVINDLKLNQRGPVEVMDKVSRALPDLLWLDRMEVTGNEIRLDGRALNTNAVASFIENLNKTPGFSEPVLGDANQQRGGVYAFVLRVRYTLVKPETAAEEAEAAASSG